MPNFALSTVSTTSANLASGEFGFVGKTGGIATSGTALTMAGGSAAVLNGAVASQGNVVSMSAGARLTILRDGSVTGTGNFSNGIALSLQENGTTIVNNAGTISGRSGIAWGIVSLGINAGVRVTNTGTIMADLDSGAAVNLRQAGTGSIIVSNAGTMSGQRGIEIGVVSPAEWLIFRITNSGLIEARDSAITGSNLSDVVINSGRIVGDVALGGGNDTFNGRGGTVSGVVYGGDGDDFYRIDDPGIEIVEASGVGTGRDTVASGADAFVLPDNIEVLILSPGARAGTGNALANEITGNGRGNVIEGNAGDDTITGAGGRDTIDGGDGFDRILGGAGDDEIRGGTGADTINGESGDDVLIGQQGNDSLIGFSGDDVLWGGAGNDTLIGSDGEDTMTGGRGFDRFVFGAQTHSLPASPDVITDFEPGIDRIVLPPSPGLAFIGTANFSAPNQVRFTSSGGSVLVQVNTAGPAGPEMAIIVDGVGSLTAADFGL